MTILSAPKLTTFRAGGPKSGRGVGARVLDLVYSSGSTRGLSCHSGLIQVREAASVHFATQQENGGCAKQFWCWVPRNVNPNPTHGI